ncbi:DUF6578 domain-containing protein [Cryptosporangium japonicum]|uniref:Uncharacterized protein n=1 Tax=Cryptosporangium japonicum TaxID=80872 RepID=A0ABN0THA3_9ACTN
MRQTIWVDGWQQQCCGAPFAVGSAVEWTLRAFDGEWLRGLLGDRGHVPVDGAEEHHDGVHQETPITLGVVAAIEAVHCRLSAGSPREPVPGTGTRSAVTAADVQDTGNDDRMFLGYVVTLEDCRTVEATELRRRRGRERKAKKRGGARHWRG